MQRCLKVGIIHGDEVRFPEVSPDQEKAKADRTDDHGDFPDPEHSLVYTVLT